MYKLHIALCALVLAHWCGAQRIVLSETTFDFGDIENVHTVTREITVRNEGDADLKLGKIKASCGCTAALIDRTTIPPGEEAALSVSFNPSGFMGRQNKKVFIASNDPTRKKAEIAFTVNIKPVWFLKPSEISFKLKEDASGYVSLQQEVEIHNATTETITLTGTSSRRKEITGVLPEEKQIAPGNFVTAVVSIDPSMRVKNSTYVMVKIDGNVGDASAYLKLTAKVKGPPR